MSRDVPVVGERRRGRLCWARPWPLGKAAPSGTPLLYLVTSGAELGWTCFMMVWIQFRRIPDVMAERVNSPSFVYIKNKALSGATVSSPPPKEVRREGCGHLRSTVYAPLGQTRPGEPKKEQSCGH